MIACYRNWRILWNNKSDGSLCEGTDSQSGLQNTARNGGNAHGADLQSADTFFIGQTHDDLQVAAVPTTPVFLLFMCLWERSSVSAAPR